jgi:hypothetical protein
MRLSGHKVLTVTYGVTKGSEAVQYRYSKLRYMNPSFQNLGGWGEPS